MRSLKSFIVLSILFCSAFFDSVYAQEKEGAEIEVKVLPTQENTVLYNGVWYMLPEEELNISIRLNEKEKISSIKEAKIFFNSEERALKSNVKDYLVEFQNEKFKPKEFEVNYSLSVSIDYSVILTSSSGKDSIVERSSSRQHSEKVKMMNNPRILSVTTLDRKQYYHGSVLDFRLDVEGGNSKGWKFEWPEGESTKSDYTLETGTKGEQLPDGSFDNSFDVVIKNYAPDGETVWYSETKKYEIYSFEKPIVNLDKKYMVHTGNYSITISPKVEDRNLGTWNYMWYKGNSLMAESRELEAFGAQNPCVEKYRLVAINSLNGHEIFRDEKDFELISVSLDWKNELPVKVVEGDEIVAEIIREGGDEYTWTYTWTYSWTNESDNGNKCIFFAPQGTLQGSSYVLTLKAECEGFSHTLPHRYTVYSTPNATPKSLDDIVLLNEQSYKFSISTEGGDPDGWNYEWYIDGKKINEAVDVAYDAMVSNESSEVKYLLYTVKAKNLGKVCDVNFNVEVWPSVTETHSDEKHDLYYDDNEILKIDIIGGYKDGWKYEWSTKDGSIVSTTNIYNYFSEKNESASKTEYIYLKIVNSHEKAPNSVLYVKDILFTITSWSHGGISDLYCNVDNFRSGDKIPVSVSTEGGYPNWTYYWYYNDELVNQTENGEYVFIAKENKGTQPLRLTT